MSRRFPLLTAAALLAAAVASCGGAGNPSSTDAPAAPSTTAPPVVTTGATPTTAPPKADPTSPDVPIPTIPEGVDPATVSYVADAIAVLADATGADPADIEVVGFEEVVWRDGSVGCPMPGMNYTQALVDGTRVALDLDGEVYLLHAAGTTEPFVCENPAEPLG